MRRNFEVWFYIGAILSFYGLLLLAAGITQWIHPPQTVLSGEHATFWAGVALLLLGSVYIAIYRPRKGKQNSSRKKER